MRLEDAIQQRAFADEYEKLAVNLFYTHNQFAALFEQTLQPYDISPEQYNVLRILRGKHPSPMALKEIQARMLNKMSNTSRLVEKLRRKGLVERLACASDRRAVDITLTAAGLEQLELLDGVVGDIRYNYQTLDPDEAKHLNELLDKLRG